MDLDSELTSISQQLFILINHVEPSIWSSSLHVEPQGSKQDTI
jgi:hypothetical protein